MDIELEAICRMEGEGMEGGREGGEAVKGDNRRGGSDGEEERGKQYTHINNASDITHFSTHSVVKDNRSIWTTLS